MLVYLLTNEVNGKYYVGKTSLPNLYDYLSVKRWAARHGKMLCMPLIRAMRKYGVDQFTAQVLAKTTDYEQLNQLERLWIVALDARNSSIGYNLTAGGEGIRMPCSAEKKLKIGLANKGRKPKGYARTAEHRQQIKERMIGSTHRAGDSGKWLKDMPVEYRQAKARKAAEARWGG